MSVALTLTEEQRALAEVVRSFCRTHCPDEVWRSGAFPAEFWRGLAELGVLSLAVPGEGGGAGDIAAAGAELGRAAAPGPWAATVFATHVLPSELSAQVADGSCVASAGAPPLLPWAPAAGVFVETDGDSVWLAEADSVEPVEVLGGEQWGRVALTRVQPLERVEAATALSDIAAAAYLSGAGRRLLNLAVEHARVRVQFGRPIGTFQAVAHPLVNSGLSLTAAEKLTTMAALALDDGHPDGTALAAAARCSGGRAAVEAAEVAHQTFGAIGYSVEGPIGPLSQRIRHQASRPGCADKVAANYRRKGRER
ncbi:acyl-CoA dehydrogenase [Amycolatopsis sp. AA4]|uniref:acyl-CoA dehydrogenase family protein n=1 Tax=Actinomycetes TaxID=1760 RepID=UPI0001B55ADD|nr:MULTISPECIES: acyl-CoA dehydrogenase family protein [Actinomycetes]ATY11678.1 acyl-CoA dehydrogenase [Amycolatopsis sp. AA4]EFL07336.1 hypothetical protein SSMG_03007 [Streptomyces sp. AA4]